MNSSFITSRPVFLGICNNKKRSKENIQLISIISPRLTHLNRMDPPTRISRTRSFPMLGVLGGVFHFIQILIEHIVCKQTVEILTYKTK